MTLASIRETSLRHTFRRALPALACAGLAAIAACASLDSPNPGGSCAAVGTLTVGDTLQDAITTSSCRLSDQSYVNFYNFRVDSQTTLAVTLESPLQSALMWVVDSASLAVGLSAAGTATSMRIILRPGRYQLAVNSYSPSPSGTFRVLATRDASPVRGCVPVWVTSGMTTTQTITTADCTAGPLGVKYYYHLYLHSIQGADEVKLTEHATAFPPEVWLVSQSGAAVAYSSIDSTGANANVDYLPQGADYLLVWVGSTDSLQVGQYTLTIP